MIRSIYTDFLEGGGVCSIEEFLRPGNDNQIPFFSMEYAKFDNVVSMYQELLGGDRVLVLPFELVRSDPCGFLQRILAFAGVPVLERHELAEIAGSEANVTDKRRSAFLSFFVVVNLLGRRTNNNARIALGWSAARQVAVHYGARVTPRRWAERRMRSLTRRIDEAVGDTFVESNNRLAGLVDWRPEDYGYEVGLADGASSAD